MEYDHISQHRRRNIHVNGNTDVRPLAEYYAQEIISRRERKTAKNAKQETQEPETKPVKAAEKVTPKPRKISKTNKDSQVIQDIIRDLDALTPDEILNDTSKLDIICEDLQAALSGMKKAYILEFAAQHKICLRSLKKNAPIKTFAGYICKKIAMFKTIEAKQATAHKANKPVEPQNKSVAQTSEQSKSVNIPVQFIGRQIAVVLEGQNYMFDFGPEAA